MTESRHEPGISHGPPRVCPPHRLLLIAVLALTAGVVSNRWVNARTNENYVGHIEVDSVTVRAPVDGILQSWNVEEGETVDPQTLICKIGGHDLKRKIQQKEQEVARLSARLKTQQAEIDVKLNEHLRTVESDIYKAELQTADLLQKRYFYELEILAWREKREKLSEESPVGQSLNISGQAGAKLAQSGELDDGLIRAMLKEESAVNSMEATEAQLEICEERLDKLKTQKDEMRQQVRQAVGISETELHLAQARDELKQLMAERKQQQVLASHLGVIANFHRRSGEHVKAGEILAELFLEDEAYAVAEVPTSDSHHFDVETPVKCRFPNGEVRTGVVTRVSVAASHRESATRNSGPTVPMRIEQTGALWPEIPIGGEITVIR